METQKQTQHSEFHPSEMNGMRMAVIEYRTIGGHEWVVHSLYDDGNEVNGGYLGRRCKKLANRSLNCEFRWRCGWLNLDPSDKCEIFKSE